MKCKMTIVQRGTATHPVYPNAEIPVGHIHDAPDAYKLVQAGSAIPADEECRLACKMTQAEIDLAQKHYPAMEAGIEPDDREAWFAGEMIGYNFDSSPIPGPNFVQEEDDEYDDESWYQPAEYQQPEEYKLAEEETTSE